MVLFTRAFFVFPIIEPPCIQFFMAAKLRNIKTLRSAEMDLNSDYNPSFCNYGLHVIGLDVMEAFGSFISLVIGAGADIYSVHIYRLHGYCM